MKPNKNQTLDFTSKLSDFEIVNREFIRCKCYMLATGDNVNGSDITLEAVQKAMSRGEFYNKPVVAHLYKDEENGQWRVGGHDSKWIITNTSIEMVNECIPFGVIPESSNIQLEEVLEADGVTVNTYLTCQIILWVGRFNIMDAAYSDDIYFNQSCELSINEYHYKDNDVLAIDDFTFSALCLLNKSDDKTKNVRPCFPSCRVEKIKAFSIDEDKFKQNFELMLEKIKQYETDGITTVPNKNETNPQKGAIKMELKKFVEILSTIKIGDTDVNKYSLLSVDDSKVYALDMEDYKPYGFNYAITTEEDVENIVVDFESKVEMSLSATEKITDENFEEFNIKSVINAEAEKYAETKTAEHTAILEGEFNKKVDELKVSYDDLSASYAVAMKKLDEYEAKEAQAKADQHEADVKAMFEKYAEKLGKCSEFLVFKAKCNPADVTVDELNEKLTLMVGKYMMEAQTKKSFSYNPTETKVTKKTENVTASRYGSLLDKYAK